MSDHRADGSDAFSGLVALWCAGKIFEACAVGGLLAGGPIGAVLGGLAGVALIGVGVGAAVKSTKQ
jgi:hypothetical protein